ncbi:MAG: adenylosuccinate lyase [Anaerolineales bacterium]|nr:adenylosuccinate lyase [Anaerolineales bacterium]
MDHNQYVSPFSWRYGSNEMRTIWSEVNKRRLWRQIWVALAEAQSDFGLVSPEQVADLRAHADQVDIERALEIEVDIQHDVMAEVKTYAEQCPLGGGIIHLGMTSMDVVDNSDALRVRQSLELVLQRLSTLLTHLAGLIGTWADTPVMAFTHLQPAEPSTLGYRLAQYGQDLWLDFNNLERLRANIKGKGLKGAVGTSASYMELLGKENLADFEAHLAEALDLQFFPVTTQVYPRKQDYEVLSALAGLGASLYKFAFDLRLLQSPLLGELAEPFGRRQVGSSAMPFKRNPINAEKIDSLARLLAQYPRLAWDNAAHCLLERTLDDSANRRISLPEAFLVADELLLTATRICQGLQVDQAAIERNQAAFGPFAASERVLMALGKAGADRQVMHDRLRQHALQAWEQLRQGNPNPLVDLVSQDDQIQPYLSSTEIRTLMTAADYVGDAPVRAKNFASLILASLHDQ